MPSRQPHAHLPASVELERFPLTSAQTSIWIDQALHPHKPIYNTGQAILLNGAIRSDWLSAALQQIVAENDALRSIFLPGPKIQQKIVSEVEVNLRVQDFSRHTEPEAAAWRWLEDLFWQPFEPTDFPLFAFALAKVAERRFLWLQKYHHLIIDATGRQVVTARAAALYDAIARGERPPFDIRGSYRIAQQQEEAYRASARLGADRLYWEQRLATAPVGIAGQDLLSEKLRSGRPTRLICDLSRGDARGFLDAARSSGTTPFKLMLVFTWLCLWHLNDVADLVFGVPTGNRSDPKLKSMVGLLSKVMPFRIALDLDMRVTVALGAVDAALSEDLAHRNYPIEQLGQPRSRPSTGRLFDVILNYVRNDYSFEFAGAGITCRNLSSGFAVPLGIMGLEFGGDDPLQVVIDYDPGQVTADEANYLQSCLEYFLKSAADLIDTRLGDIVLPPAPRAAGAPGPDNGDAEPSRLPAREAAASADAARNSHVSDAVLADVLAVWRLCLDGRDISPEADYFELGGNSLKAIWLIGECNERFGVDLPLTAIFDYPSPTALASAIRAATAPNTSGLLVKLKDGNSGNVLVLIHPIGGTLFCYTELLSRLPGGISVYGLRASGLESGEELPSSIEDMADTYVDVLRQSIDPEGIHLAGWSFGGILAIETNRRLMLEGCATLGVTLIDTPLQAPPRLGNQDQLVRAVAHGALTAGMLFESANGASLSDEASTAPHVVDGPLGRAVRLVRNNFEMRRRFVPSRFSGPLTVIETPHGKLPDDGTGWRALVEGSLLSCFINATHESILMQPAVERVAEILAERFPHGRRAET